MSVYLYQSGVYDLVLYRDRDRDHAFMYWLISFLVWRGFCPCSTWLSLKMTTYLIYFIRFAYKLGMYYLNTHIAGVLDKIHLFFLILDQANCTG